MNRPLTGPARDVALLFGRLLLGTIMFVHGYQKLMIDGIGRTTQGFESMSIPVAILSASFVTVVELVGGVLLMLGLMTRTVAGCMGFVMAGAAGFVHVRHGVFVKDGGWELVGSIAGALLALAAAGPGRFSLAHLIRRRSQRPAVVPVPARVPAPMGPEPEVIPPAGLPVTPLIRLTPEERARFAPSAPGRPPGPPPLRHW